MDFNDLSLKDRVAWRLFFMQKGINDRNALRAYFNEYANGGSIDDDIPTITLPEVLVTPDSDYNTFLNSLPSNQKYAPESEYATHKAWELYGKPKDFNEAKTIGMYTWNDSDNSYHGNSIAWGKDGVGYFLKPKTHPTLKYELDYYNKGLRTLEDGKQVPLEGDELKDWLDFRNNYELDTTGNFYTYKPKKKQFAIGGPEEIVNKYEGNNPGGQTMKKKVPSKKLIVDLAWATENPNNRGLLPDGTYVPYPDPNGRGQDVGPGILIGQGIDERPYYTKQSLDSAAYEIGLKGLKSIGESYNGKYASKDTPTPFDTVSVAPKLLMLDTRYLNGKLPADKWPSLYRAIANGDWAEGLVLSRSTYVDEDGVKHYDNDRVRRRSDFIFPGMFNVSFIKDSKEKPRVTKKR